MYPSNEDYSGHGHSPDEFDDDAEGKTMSALEIGIIVATIITFALVLFFIFFCRHLESRRRAERVQEQLERGQEQRSDIKGPDHFTTTNIDETTKPSAFDRVWRQIRAVRRS